MNDSKIASNKLRKNALRIACHIISVILDFNWQLKIKNKNNIYFEQILRL